MIINILYIYIYIYNFIFLISFSWKKVTLILEVHGVNALFKKRFL